MSVTYSYSEFTQRQKISNFSQMVTALHQITFPSLENINKYQDLILKILTCIFSVIWQIRCCDCWSFFRWICYICISFIHYRSMINSNKLGCCRRCCCHLYEIYFQHTQKIKIGANFLCFLRAILEQPSRNGHCAGLPRICNTQGPHSLKSC